MNRVGERTWSSVELFALGLLTHGAETQYDLESKGRLSSGSAWLALKQLSSAGLVKSVRRGGKRIYSVTQEGRKTLEESWTRLMTEVPGDTESVVRAAWLAWAMGRPEVAAGYMAVAADKRSAAARKAGALAERAGERGLKNPLDNHLWMRSWVDAEVKAAEAKTLDYIVVSLAPARSKATRQEAKGLPSAFLEVEQPSAPTRRRRRK